VLVVEDEPVVRSLVAEVLENLGYGTLVAGFLEPAMQVVAKPFTVDALAQKIPSIIRGAPAG
jgi:DNA-binding response OmpR family regulator